MTLDQEIKAIDKEISKLERERRDLEMARIAEFQENHRGNIGRCFRTSDGDYVAIIDVPQIMKNRDGFSFNQYRFPCFIIAGGGNKEPGNDVQFWYDTAFSRHGDVFGNAPFKEESSWEEVQAEEFRLRLFNKLNDLYTKLCGILLPEDGKHILEAR